MVATVVLISLNMKFDPAEISASSEKSNNLALLSKLDREPTTKKSKTGDSVLNVRKAVRFASQGRGSAALARDSAGSKGRKGKR